MSTSVRRLIVMRHAKSSWDDSRVSDFQRPLNKRGSKTAPMVGELLHSKEITADVVLASPAVRVKETLAKLNPVWRSSAEILWEQSLYLATLDVLQQFIGGLHDSWRSVMFVGHNPGLSQLVQFLTEQPAYLPTAAVAVLEVNSDHWSQAALHRPWRQLAMWKPKELFDISD